MRNKDLRPRWFEHVILAIAVVLVFSVWLSTCERMGVHAAEAVPVLTWETQVEIPWGDRGQGFAPEWTALGPNRQAFIRVVPGQEFWVAINVHDLTAPIYRVEWTIRYDSFACVPVTRDLGVWGFAAEYYPGTPELPAQNFGQIDLDPVDLTPNPIGWTLTGTCVFPSGLAPDANGKPDVTPIIRLRFRAKTAGYCTFPVVRFIPDGKSPQEYRRQAWDTAEVLVDGNLAPCGP
jgi:hypothetical protein